MKSIPKSFPITKPDLNYCDWVFLIFFIVILVTIQTISPTLPPAPSIWVLDDEDGENLATWHNGSSYSQTLANDQLQLTTTCPTTTIILGSIFTLDIIKLSLNDDSTTSLIVFKSGRQNMFVSLYLVDNCSLKLFIFYFIWD